ncbi:putative secreted lipase [Metarhizium anisopliae]
MAEVPSIRNDFYIGGMSTMEQNLPRPDANNYVEQLKPVNGTTQKTPIVTIHGQAQTGTVDFSNTVAVHPT